MITDFKPPKFKSNKDEWKFYVKLHFYGMIFYKDKYIKTKKWNTKEAKKIKKFLDFVRLKTMSISDNENMKAVPYPKEYYTKILNKYVKTVGGEE